MVDCFKQDFIRIVKEVSSKTALTIYKYFWGGSREGGKTYAWCELFSYILDLENVNTDVYYLRTTSIKCKESFNEFRDNWMKKLVNGRENIGDMTIECDGGTSKNNRIRFLGVDKLNLKEKEGASNGIGMRNDRDYIFVLVEESQQINYVALQSMFDSLRSNVNTKMCYIFLLNPTNRNKPIVKDMCEMLEPRLSELKTKGYQSKILSKSYEGITKNIKIVWNNWKTATENGKFVISEDKRFDLMEQDRKFPELAKCNVWGFPYSLGGLSFKNTDKAIKVPVVRRYDFFTIGLDVASGRTRKSAVNAATILGWVDDYHCEVLTTITVDNRLPEFQNPQVRAKEFIKWFIQFKKDYQYNTMTTIEGEIPVFVDAAAQDFIHILNTELSNADIEDEFCAYSCKKYEKEVRTMIIDYAFSCGTCNIFANNIGLIAELNTLENVETKSGKIERQDGGDDIVNSFEYAIGERLYDLVDEKARWILNI